MEMREAKFHNDTVKRRRWSPEQKARIVQEASAPDANVSAVARNYAIKTSLLFAWIKQLEPGFKREVAVDATNPMDVKKEYQKMFAVIRKREELVELSANGIIEAARNNRITAYNLSTSVSTIVTATAKLQERKLDLLERLTVLEEEQDIQRSNHSEEKVDFEVERLSEKICYELVKRQVEQQRAAANRQVSVVNQNV